MNQLDKLKEQYEKENPGEKAEIDFQFKYGFVKWLINQIEILTSRPTCGVEQRKFLNEIEQRGKLNKVNDMAFKYKDSDLLDGESFLFNRTFEADLQKVLKGE